MTSRWLLILGLTMLAATFLFYQVINHYLPSIQLPLMDLQTFIEYHVWMTGILFLSATALLINVPIPLAALLKLISGFLFGPVIGAVINVAASLLASLLGFVAVRYWFRRRFEARFAARTVRINAELDRYGFYYFILLRLVLVVPYYLIHAVAGLSHMRLATFMLSSVIGVIPAAVLYAYAGAQMQALALPGFEAGLPQILFGIALFGLFLGVRVLKNRVGIDETSV